MRPAIESKSEKFIMGRTQVQSLSESQGGATIAAVVKPEKSNSDVIAGRTDIRDMRVGGRGKWVKCWKHAVVG
jgi:hypothetical protein